MFDNGKFEMNPFNPWLLQSHDEKCNFFFPLKIFICLAGRVTEREWEKQTSSICCFISEVSTMARPGPSRSQEPGVSVMSPIWIRGPTHPGHLVPRSQAVSWQLHGKWSSWVFVLLQNADGAGCSTLCHDAGSSFLFVCRI